MLYYFKKKNALYDTIIKFIFCYKLVVDFIVDDPLQIQNKFFFYVMENFT